MQQISVSAVSEEELRRRVEENEKRGWAVITDMKKSFRPGQATKFMVVMRRENNEAKN